eukprot:6668102-Karenia_brevis.AAC.1
MAVLECPLNRIGIQIITGIGFVCRESYLECITSQMLGREETTKWHTKRSIGTDHWQSECAEIFGSSGFSEDVMFWRDITEMLMNTSFEVVAEHAWQMKFFKECLPHKFSQLLDANARDTAMTEITRFWKALQKAEAAVVNDELPNEHVIVKLLEDCHATREPDVRETM